MNNRRLRFINGDMVEYEILPLVDQYAPILRTPCEPLDFEKEHGKDVAYWVMSLIESCAHYHGLGLSANQVGLKHRICAINLLDEGKVYGMINPVVIDKSDKIAKYKEGCLSFPGLFLEIGRPEWVEVEFQAANGETVKKKYEGIWATCVQHELDHLDGKLYTDLISPIKLDMAKRKVKQNLRKIRRVTAPAV